MQRLSYYSKVDPFDLWKGDHYGEQRARQEQGKEEEKERKAEASEEVNKKSFRQEGILTSSPSLHGFQIKHGAANLLCGFRYRTSWLLRGHYVWHCGFDDASE